MACAFYDNRNKTCADPAVRFVHELGNRRALRILRVGLPHEVAQAEGDGPVVVQLERLELVLMMTEDAVRSGVDPCLCLTPLKTTHRVRPFLSPVGGNEHEIGGFGCLSDRIGDRFCVVTVGHAGAIILRKPGSRIRVDTSTSDDCNRPTTYLHDDRFVGLLDVGSDADRSNTDSLEVLSPIEHCFEAEVHCMVVCEVRHLDARGSH